MYEKLKSLLADDALFTAILLILVGVVSFGLGRQSILENGQGQVRNQAAAGITFIQAEKSAENPLKSTYSDGVRVVASKSGSKYHLLTCPGATQIKEENKVYFDSKASAEAAGYGPAANCEGI